MAYFHGARSIDAGTSAGTPVTAESGITVVLGAVPAFAAEEGGKDIVYAQTFEEAKRYCGYSDNWKKYTACEAMYVFFKLHNVGPLIIINTLNTEKSKKEASGEKAIAFAKFELPFDAIKSTLKVYAQKGGTVLAEGTDYDAQYDGGALVVTVTAGGALDEAESCYVEYMEAGETTAEDIIGGYDSVSGKPTGAELIDYVYHKYNVIPDIAIAPGFSSKPEVAAVLAAKMAAVSTVFKGGSAYVDIDAKNVKTYSEVPEAKKQAGMTAGKMYVLWPMIKLEERVFHFSTVAAALTAATDATEGDPSDSPSNHELKGSAACLADGSEISLSLTQANYLNANGIATALSFIGGLRLWGNDTANFPAETDTAAHTLCMRRMKGWVANTLILTHWLRVDRRQTRRLIDNVADSANIWLNGYIASGHILSGNVSVTADDNPNIDVIGGITRYRVKLGLCGPNREMEFIVEYDAEAAAAALSI